MNSTLVLFDIDGTLVDTAGAGRRAMASAFGAVFGVEDMDRLVAAIPFAGNTDLGLIDLMATAAGIGPERLAEGRPAFRDTYCERLRSEVERSLPRSRVLPGVRPLLEHLDALPTVDLGLLTGNLEQGARIKLEPFDLNRYFAVGGFGSDHADRREVARAAYRRASERTGRRYDHEAVYVVGDTENDIDCAHHHGFRALAVATGWGNRAGMEQTKPHALLENLDDTERVLDVLGVAGHAGA